MKHFYNLLAALALIFAALATHSASAWGAFTADNNAGTAIGEYGFVIDVATQAMAMSAAIANCKLGGGDDTACETDVTTFQNQCAGVTRSQSFAGAGNNYLLGLRPTIDGTNVPAGATFIGGVTAVRNLFSFLDQQIAVQGSIQDPLRTYNGGTIIEAGERFICDNTCTAGEQPRTDPNIAGCSIPSAADCVGTNMPVFRDNMCQTEDCTGTDDGILDTNTGRCDTDACSAANQVDSGATCGGCIAGYMEDTNDNNACKQLANCTGNQIPIAGNLFACDMCEANEQNDGNGVCECVSGFAEDTEDNNTCKQIASCTGNQAPNPDNMFVCIDCGDNETNIDNVCACDANSIGEMGSCMACVNGTPNDDADACICDANHNQFANPGAADGCVPNEVCDAPNEILINEDSACMACGVNQGPDETGRACQCDSLSYSADGITECQICGDNQVSSEDRTSCMCATDFNDFAERGMCVQNMDCGNDVATDEGSRCIAFSYIVDDTIEGSGTTETPYELAFESTGDLQITVSDSGNDLTYSKTGGSDELQVSRDGVVSFTPESEIASGTYNIVIAAVDETTSAELSLYVNVATPVVVKPDSDLQIDNPAVKAAVIAAGLGLIMYIAVNDSVPLFSWTPSYAFNHNNGNTSYSLGSRWTATADNWNFYWQTATGGEEINYGSGVRYQNGLFYAAMDSDSNLEKTDLDISLTANKAIGVWRFNGGYNLDAILSETDTETQNRLNIAAQYTVDRWILSATANTDGETSAARVNYSYRF